MPNNKPKSGSDYGALTLYQLIGAPLKALIDAEAQSAMATARYIEKVGFETSTDPDLNSAAPFESPLGDLRTVKFNVRRPDTDGQPVDSQVELPLLSMLPIPALQIKNAELEYAVKILETRLRDAPREQIGQRVRQSVSTGVGAREGDEEDSELAEQTDHEVELTAVYGRSDEATRQRNSLDMQIRMKVNVEQADLPSGLARLLNLMDATGGMTQLPPAVSELVAEQEAENEAEQVIDPETDDESFDQSDVEPTDDD